MPGVPVAARPAMVVLTPRVLFVNGGILGLISFHGFLRRMLPRQSAIHGEQLLLTEDLTLADRAVRRLMALRLWKDGLFGVSNLDFRRFRLELFAGLLARRRIGALDSGAFDVLHFHRQATAYGSLDLMRRIPSIVSVDTTQQCVIDQAKPLERLTYRPNLRVDGAVFRRAFAIVATSRWAANSIAHYYPDCSAHVHVLPNPVLIDFFDERWIQTRRARAENGATPRVLFIGGDFPRKGGYDLLHVWQEGAFHTRAALDLVTDWPIDRRLPPGVTVHRGIRAHTPEWSARWSAADIFVMPTRNEAFGLVFQEAAAAGLPAVGPAQQAIPEIIAHERTGLLVRPGDKADLGNAIDRLIASAALRQELGLAARAFIEESACPDRYMEKLTAIILAAARARST